MNKIALKLFCLTVLCMVLPSCHTTNDNQEYDKLRSYCISQLQQGKTYLLEENLDGAINHYASKGDTVSLLEMYQLAAIRMRWKNEQDSAAMYLTAALNYTTANTSPNTAEMYINLANLYAHPLLTKDYKKAIYYSHQALASAPDSLYISRALHDIGLFHAFLNENDSANHYFEMALAITSPDNPDYPTFALNYAGNNPANHSNSIYYLNQIKGTSLGKLITLGFHYLNNKQTEKAQEYLVTANELFDQNPEGYSVNTYNNLRLLAACTDYAINGTVSPGEGTLRNDSLTQRLALMQRLETEKNEYNHHITIKLLESESKRQKLLILCLSAIIIGSIAFTMAFWRSKRRYIRLREELELMRVKQIVAESEEVANQNPFDFIRQRANLCIDQFRKTGLANTIQKGELAYNEDNSFLPLKERNALQHGLLECFSDFIVDLKIDAGKLSMDDIITCVLSLLHISNAAIAACTGTSDGAIRTRKTRLKSKLSPEMSTLIFG